MSDNCLLQDLGGQEGEWVDLAPILGHHIGNFMNKVKLW